jgi:hypothetical protein
MALSVSACAVQSNGLNPSDPNYVTAKDPRYSFVSKIGELSTGMSRVEVISILNSPLSRRGSKTSSRTCESYIYSILSEPKFVYVWFESGVVSKFTDGHTSVCAQN